jgi:hypothetical protein
LPTADCAKSVGNNQFLVEHGIQMATDTLEANNTSRWSRIGSVLLHEFREVIPPTLFFFVGFNLVLFTKWLFLEQYLIEYAGFFIATTDALIVSKVVLIADKMPFLRRFDYAPLGCVSMSSGDCSSRACAICACDCRRELRSKLPCAASCTSACL